MKFIKVYIFVTILLLTGCKSSFNIPSKYVDSCHYIDMPGFILEIKKNDRFVLSSPNSFERTIGNWEIKKDSLILNSKYLGSMIEKDSTPYQKKYIFIIKKNILINPNNEKCFLKRQK